MDSINPGTGNAPWSTWQKIAFRFFFIFFSLEVLTDNFIAVLFGDALMAIVRVTEKIFVAPCLWLNNHVFHFPYTPMYGFNFTPTLHLIRDIVYLLLAVVACLAWTVLDRKRHGYNKINYWFSQCLVIALSCMMFSYGIIKVIPEQMQKPTFLELQTPLGELSPFSLLWYTFGYGTPYQVFSGVCEVICAILILFKRTRVAGLLIALSVIVNIVMVNYTYRIGVLITAIYLLCITLFLLTPFLKQLLRFFFTSQLVKLHIRSYSPLKSTKTKWLIGLAVLFIGSSFSLSSYHALRVYAKRKKINNSAQHSLVKNFILNSDTLPLIENDTTRWRIWSEKVSDGKRMVTIASMKQDAEKTYSVEQDSLKQQLILHPVGQADTTPLNFSYTNINTIAWRLEGVVQQNKLRIELQKINPDTAVKLFKLKRGIIILDNGWLDR